MEHHDDGIDETGMASKHVSFNQVVQFKSLSLGKTVFLCMRIRTVSECLFSFQNNDVIRHDMISCLLRNFITHVLSPFFPFRVPLTISSIFF